MGGLRREPFDPTPSCLGVRAWNTFSLRPLDPGNVLTDSPGRPPAGAVSCVHWPLFENASGPFCPERGQRPDFGPGLFRPQWPVRTTQWPILSGVLTKLAYSHYVKFREKPDLRRIAQMWPYLQMWFPLSAVALTAAICFGVASLVMSHEKTPP